MRVARAPFCLRAPSRFTTSSQAIFVGCRSRLVDFCLIKKTTCFRCLFTGGPHVSLLTPPYALESNRPQFDTMPAKKQKTRHEPTVDLPADPEFEILCRPVHPSTAADGDSKYAVYKSPFDSTLNLQYTITCDGNDKLWAQLRQFKAFQRGRHPQTQDGHDADPPQYKNTGQSFTWATSSQYGGRSKM